MNVDLYSYEYDRILSNMGLPINYTRGGKTVVFRFPNGFTKQKSFKTKEELEIYVEFFKKVYNKNPNTFSDDIENILRRNSIRFRRNSKGPIAQVSVREYDADGNYLSSTSKSGKDILKCYDEIQKELEKPKPKKPVVMNKELDIIPYLIKQIEKKDAKIESLEQKVEVLQISTDNAVQKIILRYTTCPICGGEQIIKESSEGHHFLGCVNYNDDPEAHKRSGLSYDDIAKILHRAGLLRTYEEWRYGL